MHPLSVALALLFRQSGWDNHFLKNMVVIGFLLHIIGMGSGPHSLNDDRWGDGTAKT